MTAEKTINGYWRISDIINGYLVTRVYVGYTKSESIRLFKQDTKESR